MLSDRRPCCQEKGGGQEEGGEDSKREEREDKGGGHIKYRGEWRGRYKSLVWSCFVLLIPGVVAGDESNKTDCSGPDSDCLSVDVILFIMFLGAVTLGMFLSWVILWIIMRVSRKK